MSILVAMIDSAFAPSDSGVGTGYASATAPTTATPDQPPTASATPATGTPSAYSNPTPPKKKGSGIKLALLGVFVLLLVGGLAVAYYLSQQQQEIRQQAQQKEAYEPHPFTLQDTNNNVELVFTRDGAGPSEVKGTFSYPSNPSCDANSSCNAQMKFEITDIVADGDYICTTNTANLVHYTFLTNTSDPNYPGNLTANQGANTANCNRPISQCGSDPQCTTSEIIRLYGPSGCGDECRIFEASLPFSISNTEYGCGCVQFDPNIAELSLNCRRRDQQEMTTYTFTRGTSSGPWAYGYNVDQCSVPQDTPTPTPPTTSTPTPTPPTGSTPTPTPTSRVTATPTPTTNPSASPTPTPPMFGGSCQNITSSPTSPKYGDDVTFTCGLVSGVTNYEFRYYEPGSTSPKTLGVKSKNVSNPLSVSKEGSYSVQCRICPSPTSQYKYCDDPNWGWDPV